jgi:hypothetical protein
LSIGARLVAVFRLAVAVPRVVVISVPFMDVGYRMSVLSISGWSGFSVVAVIAVMSDPLA